MSAVSRALSGGSVSASKKADVLRVAKELGYRPSTAARSLVHRQSHSVTLVTGRLHDSFDSQFLDCLAEALADTGRRLIVAPASKQLAASGGVYQAIDDRSDAVVIAAGTMPLESSRACVRAGLRVITMAPKDRGCAMVFQNYALYPHLSVSGNIGYGLRVAGMPKKERQAKILEVSSMLQIDHLLDRKPGHLSGGQRQRVAIARAIAREPRVFLFDEPLSNLDAKLRTAMRSELRKLHDRIGATSIFVTHDQVEAMTLADKIVVVNRGRIAQVGSPHDIYHEPRSRFVADFIGSPAINIFDAAVQPDGVTAMTSFGLALPVRGLVHGNSAGRRIALGIRPENLAVDDSGLPVTLEHIEDMGNHKVLFCKAGGCEIRVLGPGDRAFTAGSILYLRVRNSQVVVFEEDREREEDSAPF